MAQTKIDSDQIGAGAVVTADLADKAVTLSKMADMATSSVVYRRSAGAGTPEVNTISQLASDMGVLSNPMTTGGDIIYGGTNGAPTRLPNGSSGQALVSSGGTAAPSWQSVLSSIPELIYQNIILEGIRRLKYSVLAFILIVNGLIDAFADQTGIDGVNSTNQVYNSSGYYYTNQDQYGVDLLNFDGTNGGTTFTDTGYAPLSWTGHGTAQLSTSAYKFGTASLSLSDGSSWIDTPDNANFHFGSSDFTIDGWFKRSQQNANQYIIGQTDSSASASNSSIAIYFGGGNVLWGSLYSGGTSYYCGGTAVNDSNWHHVALVRYGNTLTTYLDGSSIGSTSVTGVSVTQSSYKMSIGRFGEYTTYTDFIGYIDGVRISKGIARWTANFTPPSSPYAAGNMTLVSATQTALAQSNKSRVLLYEEDVNTITINTDLLAYVSRDGGTTYTQVSNLAKVGTWGTNKNIFAGTIDISGQPSGTSMKMKATTPTGQALRLHGWGLAWD